jgi:hypothetical protein
VIRSRLCSWLREAVAVPPATLTRDVVLETRISRVDPVTCSHTSYKYAADV